MEDVIIFEEMIGKKFDKVYQYADGYIIFEKDGVPEFIFYHDQDCCESVFVEDIVGDLEDLALGFITEAEEYTKNADRDVSESGTYTYYKFSSTKGCVNIRWLGESNGYYSESVDYFSWKNHKNGNYLDASLRVIFKGLYPTLEV